MGKIMKNCISCGANLPDESQYCNVCGASQMTGVYKVAETAGMLGRGAYRCGVGALFGAFLGIIFWGVLLSYTYHLEYYYDTRVYNEVALTILIVITCIVCAVGSAPSWKFFYLVGYSLVFSMVGGIVWLFICPMLHYPDILGKIIFLIIIIVCTPLAWIWYIVQKGLVVPNAAKPKSVVASIKTEFVDTAKEIKRFGRGR